MPIVQALERLGYTGEGVGLRWLHAEEDAAGTCGMAIVGDDTRRGVASADYSTEADAPLVRWASDRGDMLRLWQAEMGRLSRRCGQVEIGLLMGDMQ